MLERWSGFPESGVDWVLRHRKGWIQIGNLFAGAVIEARLPIEDRIGSHLVQCLVVRQDLSEEGMVKIEIWWLHGVVYLGSDEELRLPWPLT